MEIDLHSPPQKWGNLSCFADMKPIFLLREETGMQEDKVACPACLNAAIKSGRDYS